MDEQKLAEAIAKSLKQSGGLSGGGGSSTKYDSTNVKASLDGLKQEATLSEKALKGFASAATETIDVFRQISKSGSNFSNDLVGLSAAAAGTRQSLGEFASVITENGKYLTGLGGSVTRGTEAFAKLSKGFFDSNLDKELRNLGYTSKDINEVLALQASIQRTANSNTVDGQKATAMSAQAMAKEMDLMAKLTGKSRQEQMDIMNRNKVDGQVEAKLRLMTMGKTEEEARKIRLEAQAALKQAELEGRGQMAKELFATGTVISEEARNQFATFNKAGQDTAKQFQAISKGQFDNAKQYGEQATAAMLKAQQDPTRLAVAALGDAAGPIGQTMVKNIETMGPFNDAVQATAKSMGNLLTTQEDYAKALRAAKDEIIRASAGVDKGKTRVGGTVEAVTAFEKAGQDIKAGIAGAVMQRDNNNRSIATEASRAGYIAAEGVSRLQGPQRNIGASLEESAKQGIQGPLGSGGPLGVIAKATLEATTVAVNTTGSITLNATGKAQSMTDGQAVKRSTGSLGATGKLLEDFGQGTMAVLHGKEGVITEDQLNKLVRGVQQAGAQAVAGKFVEAKDKLKAVDVSKMSEQVRTTVSSASAASIDPTSAATSAGPQTITLDPAKMVEQFSASVNTSSGPNLNALSNLPGFGDIIKSTAATVPAAVKPPISNPQTQSQPTPISQPSTQPAQTKVTAGSDASLNDVVKSLDSLNMLMGRLINQQDQLGRKQISAVKSNSSNLYERN
jgi:hypothetical protein